MKYLDKKIIEERPNWSIADDREYYYYRGKLDAVKAISSFIEDGGGGLRKLVYDYLNLEYVDACDHGGLIISNYVFEAWQDD